MKNYNELFNTRFKTSQKIDEKFAELFNTSGLKEGIKYLKQVGATELDMDNYNIKYRISEWTKDSLSDKEKIAFLNELRDLGDYILDIKVEKNEKFNLPEVKIETTKGIIQVIQFSSVAPEVKNLFPFIESDKRFGNCYDFAYNISLNLGVPNQIVTGYIYGYSDKSKFLHSWVESNIKGEEYVIDGTLNAMINKEGYYLMQHAKPITKISDSVLKSDIKNHLDVMQTIPIETYYVFRDEIVNDLKRNNKKAKR